MSDHFSSSEYTLLTCSVPVAASTAKGAGAREGTTAPLERSGAAAAAAAAGRDAHAMAWQGREAFFCEGAAPYRHRENIHRCFLTQLVHALHPREKLHRCKSALNS